MFKECCCSSFCCKANRGTAVFFPPVVSSSISVSRDPLSQPILEVSLPDACSAIAARIQPLAQEQIPVTEGLSRINALPCSAIRPKPSYDQSTRDGFALAREPLARDDSGAFFRVIGEVAAGSRQEYVLNPGEAVRIMTGAMVPFGCERVVPFEVCRDTGESMYIPGDELLRRSRYIRFQGSDVQAGNLLLPAGTRLLPDHLLTLSENGWSDLQVYKRPVVSVICTGSELVEVGKNIEVGRKISGNSVLLSALLQQQNVCCRRSATVADRIELIREQLEKMLAEQPDMIISTGGMGPGKFDLMEQVVARMGGTVVYNRLQIRPGKATLFGLFDQVPFFALPGPPPAVRILFHELIVPALTRMQGCAEGGRELISATLAAALPIRHTGHVNLKGAVVRIVDSGLQVWPAQRMEPINAIVHLDSQRTTAQQGETVQVRLVGPLQNWGM